MIKITISPTEPKLRTDLALCAVLKIFSRSQVLSMIKSGQILRTDNKIIKPAKILDQEIEFSVNYITQKNINITAQDIPLDILYHDKYLAVINKPQGLVVHPGAGVYDKTLCHALLHHFPDLVSSDNTRPGIVHRLDKNTSGVILVAKTPDAHRILSNLFKERKIQKIYRALAHGEINTHEFELKTGHVRHPHNRLKFFTGTPAPKLADKNIRLAHSSFKILTKYSGATELQVLLHTGRTHQIRAHLADIGHPIIGDELYGSKYKNLIGQALHAESLSFVHPFTKIQLSFTAPLPDYWVSLKNLFDKHSV